MKTIYICIITLFIGTPLLGQIEIPAKPTPPKLVNDFTNTLSRNEEQQLEKKLRSYNDSTSTQLVILIVPTYGDYDPNEFGVKVFDEWGIGQQTKNNGLLISVAMNQRKMFINTGYGMESIVPDGAASTIVDQYMKPAFRNKNYFKGLDDATTVIFDLAAGKYTADSIRANKDAGKEIGLGAFLVFFFIVITIISRFRRVRRHHLGGGALDIITMMTLLGGSGRNHGGTFGDFNSGGGGFGGFGGGMTGGGGAGGSW